MTDIIPFNRAEAIGPRCQRLFQEWRAAADRWFEKTMELAEALLAARTACGGSDIQFARWLIENGLEDLHPKTRTALIGMAMHPDVSAGMLRISGRQSVRYIWEEEIKPYLAGDPRTAIAYIWEAEIKPLVESGSATVESLQDGTEGLVGLQCEPETKACPLEKSQENQSDMPLSKPLGQARQPEEPHPVTRQHDHDQPVPVPPEAPVAEASAQMVKISAKAGYHGLPRAEQVMALFPKPAARTVLSKALKPGTSGRQELWTMILTCMDEGLLRRTDYAPFTDRGKVPLRLLLSDLPESINRDYDLSVPYARKEVRTVILPAVLAQKEAYLKDPASLKKLVNDWKIRKNAELSAALATKKHAPPAITPPDSRPVIAMYGQQLWPIVETRFGTYSYDQLRTAIWSFQQLDRWLQMTNDSSPKSRAIMIRFSTRYFSAYAERALDKDNSQRMGKVFQLMHTLAHLLETSPDGECTPPVTPHGNLGWD